MPGKNGKLTAFEVHALKIIDKFNKSGDPISAADFAYENLKDTLKKEGITSADPTSQAAIDHGILLERMMKAGLLKQKGAPKEEWWAKGFVLTDLAYRGLKGEVVDKTRIIQLDLPAKNNGGAAAVILGKEKKDGEKA